MSTAAGSEPLSSPRDAVLRLVDPLDDAAAEENTLQGHALALESHCLRRRADRFRDALDDGHVVERSEVLAVLRAFRAYRPFVFRRDRALNDAASRTLIRATSEVPHSDASVA